MKSTSLKRRLMNKLASAQKKWRISRKIVIDNLKYWKNRECPGGDRSNNDRVSSTEMSADLVSSERESNSGGYSVDGQIHSPPPSGNVVSSGVYTKYDIQRQMNVRRIKSNSHTLALTNIFDSDNNEQVQTFHGSITCGYYGERRNKFDEMTIDAHDDTFPWKHQSGWDSALYVDNSSKDGTVGALTRKNKQCRRYSFCVAGTSRDFKAYPI